MTRETDSPDGAATSAPQATLDRLADGEAAIVDRVVAPHNAPEWGLWLEDIGFLHGERVMLLARGPFGGDPLVVRVGLSTFALRRAEAACVRLAGNASMPPIGA
jgi:ferrous iron transport protein A